MKMMIFFWQKLVYSVAFNDIGKPSKDLLSKDYPIDGIKVEVKTSAFDGTVKYRY